MVHRKRAVFNAHLHAAANRQLVGVDFGNEFSFSRRKNAVRVLHGEKAFVAEHVYEIRQLRSLRNKVDNHLHIFLVRVPAPYGVSAQIRATNRCRHAFCDAPDDPQHLKFCFR